MKEKLIIKNFGPIKNVELELGRFNVLIGEQATGKSTVAKVLAVCRYFSYIVAPNVEANDDFFIEGLKAWGLNEFVTSKSYICYECYHYKFTWEQGLVLIGNGFEDSEFLATLMPKSKEFKVLLEDLNFLDPRLNPAYKPGDDGSADFTNWRIPYGFFIKSVSAVLDNPFYIPTERGLQSIFSLGKNSIQNISDALFNQFAEIDFIAKNFTIETAIEPFNIVYKNVDGRGYIRKNNEETFYSLFNGASGYQSTIPVVLLLKFYKEFKKKAKTFIIEEPELNLFPSAQQKLMQWLVATTNIYGNSILLTTHSPYVLTSLNNLIFAWQAGKNNGYEVEKIVEKPFWLNPEEFSAYRLMEDGTAKNIVDEEIMQIDAGQLDGISRDINEVWGKIADIEYSVHG